ncbi:protein KASH5 [Pitangus sulphuratus]|nr:protein KASH5 [Pitangus sulphuratus]
MVLPQRVVEYVAAVTGHSGHEGRLRALRRALDPAASGAALDLPQFRVAMGTWIAACRQDGSVTGAVPGARSAWLGEEREDTETGEPSPALAEEDGRVALAAAQLQGDSGDMDATSFAEAAGLRSRARQLAAHNTKLQRDAELAEELNARLAEETAQLQAQLRSSRQALEQARAAAEELEDLKAVAKGLEEENGELRRHARHMEKEQRSLCLRAEGLQEEVRPGPRGCPGGAVLGQTLAPLCHEQNQRLIAEGQGLREQIQAQTARVADLEVSAGGGRSGLPVGQCRGWCYVPSPPPRPSSAVAPRSSLPGTLPLPR